MLAGIPPQDIITPKVYLCSLSLYACQTRVHLVCACLSVCLCALCVDVCKDSRTLVSAKSRRPLTPDSGGWLRKQVPRGTGSYLGSGENASLRATATPEMQRGPGPAIPDPARARNWNILPRARIAPHCNLGRHARLKRDWERGATRAGSRLPAGKPWTRLSTPRCAFGVGSCPSRRLAALVGTSRNIAGVNLGARWPRAGWMRASPARTRWSGGEGACASLRVTLSRSSREPEGSCRRAAATRSSHCIPASSTLSTFNALSLGRLGRAEKCPNFPSCADAGVTTSHGRTAWLKVSGMARCIPHPRLS